MESASRSSVIVAGAGPAGTAAAITLARRGIAVVVLDRARFPRDKVCGDVILPEAQQVLAELELDVRQMSERALRCKGARYVATDGKEISGLFLDIRGEPKPWWIIKRVIFDQWLLDAARASGADVREGWAVRGAVRDHAGAVTGVVAQSPAGQLHTLAARAVVGADGAGSAIARSVGVFNQPPDHTCLAVRAYAKGIESQSPYLEVFTSKRTLPGCAWIVPLAAGEFNVGVGILKRDGKLLASSPRRLFHELCEHVPKFGKRLAGARFERFKGWTLPGASQRRPLVGHGYLLAGDAGAMVDPFTGHGIHNALIAGRLAGEVLAEAVTANDVCTSALMKYEHGCRASFLKEAEIGYRLQRLHASAPFMRFVVRACAHPGLRRTFLSLLGHSSLRIELLAGWQLMNALLAYPRQAGSRDTFRRL